MVHGIVPATGVGGDIDRRGNVSAADQLPRVVITREFGVGFVRMCTRQYEHAQQAQQPLKASASSIIACR